MMLGTTRANSSANEGRILIPRPYQQRINRWAIEEAPEGKGMWAVDLGLGKTASALLTIGQSLYDRFDTTRWLVVAPKLVAQDTWPTQLLRWGEFKALDWRLLRAEDFELEPGIVVACGEEEQVVGSSELPALLAQGWQRLAKSGLQFRDKAMVKRRLGEYREPIHIVSWDFFPFLVQAWGASWPYDGLVLDESTFAQSSTGLRHKAAWHVVQRLKRVQRVLSLTGLPTPNGRGMLHGQIRLLDGGARLGKTKTEFYDRWMVPARMNPKTGRVFTWKVNPPLVPAMDQAVSDIMVSLSSADYLTLPPVVSNDVPVPLPGPAQATYRALERDLVAGMGEGTFEIVAASQGVLVGKLLQVCSGAVYGEDGKAWQRIHDAKLDVLAEMLEAATEPVIVVYAYGHEYERLRARFKDIEDVSDRGVLAKFKRGELQVMCGHPGSFGHGVDGLQDVCHQVVWLGATYNLEHWVQVLKRLHRDGQQRPVVVTRLLAVDTLEESIAQIVLPEKREVADALLQAVRLRVSHTNLE